MPDRTDEAPHWLSRRGWPHADALDRARRFASAGLPEAAASELWWAATDLLARGDGPGCGDLLALADHDLGPVPIGALLSATAGAESAIVRAACSTLSALATAHWPDDAPPKRFTACERCEQFVPRDDDADEALGEGEFLSAHRVACGRWCQLFDGGHDDVCGGWCAACRLALTGCRGIDYPCGRLGCSQCGAHAEMGHGGRGCGAAPPICRCAWTWERVTCELCLRRSPDRGTLTRVVFLSLDLFPAEWPGGEEAIRDALCLVSSLCDETGAAIVLAGARRLLEWPEAAADGLRRRGLTARVLGATPDLVSLELGGASLGRTRGDEVAAWLASHPDVDRWAVLDADPPPDLDPARCVRVDPARLVVEEDIRRAAAAVGRLPVAAVVLAERRGRLAGIRSNKFGGRPCVAGGKLQPGESPEQAGEREALEEVGLDLRGRLRPVGVRNIGADGATLFRCHLFAADVPEGAELRGGPKGEAAWLSREELVTGGAFAADMPAVLARLDAATSRRRWGER